MAAPFVLESAALRRRFCFDNRSQSGHAGAWPSHAVLKPEGGLEPRAQRFHGMNESTKGTGTGRRYCEGAALRRRFCSDNRSQSGHAGAWPSTR